MSIGDRLSTLSRGELVGIGLLAVVTLGGAGLWYARSLPKPVAVEAAPGGVAVASGVASVVPAVTSGAPVGASGSPAPASIFVDVAGWVRRPGVYEFGPGDRVIDAIDAAGGPRPNADLAALNLAAPLVDGTQILLMKEGPVPAGIGGTGGGLPPGAPGTTGLINVNTASATELEALPGIGEVISAAIVDYRTQNGPFTSVDQLEDVSGIGPATMENIRELVTV